MNEPVLANVKLCGVYIRGLLMTQAEMDVSLQLVMCWSRGLVGGGSYTC